MDLRRGGGEGEGREGRERGGRGEGGREGGGRGRGGREGK